MAGNLTVQAQNIAEVATAVSRGTTASVEGNRSRCFDQQKVSFRNMEEPSASAEALPTGL